MGWKLDLRKCKPDRTLWTGNRYGKKRWWKKKGIRWLGGGKETLGIGEMGEAKGRKPRFKEKDIIDKTKTCPKKKREASNSKTTAD